MTIAAVPATRSGADFWVRRVSQLNRKVFCVAVDRVSNFSANRNFEHVFLMQILNESSHVSSIKVVSITFFC